MIERCNQTDGMLGRGKAPCILSCDDERSCGFLFPVSVPVDVFFFGPVYLAFRSRHDRYLVVYFDDIAASLFRVALDSPGARGEKEQGGCSVKKIASKGICVLICV